MKKKILYSGHLEIRLANDNEHLILLRDFSIVDKRDDKWTAPMGMVTDGASIPKWLRPIIGDPFKGKTLEAAVIHDRYCATKQRSQKDTHRIFRELCRDNGVSWIRAQVMWAAVRAYNRVMNPKWE